MILKKYNNKTNEYVDYNYESNEILDLINKIYEETVAEDEIFHIYNEKSLSTFSIEKNKPIYYSQRVFVDQYRDTVQCINNEIIENKIFSNENDAIQCALSNAYTVDFKKNEDIDIVTWYPYDGSGKAILLSEIYPELLNANSDEMEH